MNDTRGAITLEGDTLYRLDFWTKVFDEPRTIGAERYVSVGLDSIEMNYLIHDPCPALMDGLVEYKRLRATGAGNGILRTLIDKMQRELGYKVKPK